MGRPGVGRPRALAAQNDGELETVIDEMVAAQPTIKPVVTSRGAVIVSGHPLASEAGRLAFEKGRQDRYRQERALLRGE